MIIKFTFNDNDFTQVIEKFLADYEIFNADYFNSIKEHFYFKNDISNYEDLNKKDREILKQKLLTTIKQVFTNYINNIKVDSNWNTEGFTAKEVIESKEYILKNIKIEIVNSITDKWQNGEVVYYITSNMKYLTM